MRSDCPGILGTKYATRLTIEGDLLGPNALFVRADVRNDGTILRAWGMKWCGTLHCLMAAQAKSTGPKSTGAMVAWDGVNSLSVDVKFFALTVVENNVRIYKCRVGPRGLRWHVSAYHGPSALLQHGHEHLHGVPHC